MNGTIAWFGNNPVAANLVMVFIIVSGLVASTSIRTEIFSEIALDRISIQVPYLGAAPEEVESGVVVRIEEAIRRMMAIRKCRRGDSGNQEPGLRWVWPEVGT